MQRFSAEWSKAQIEGIAPSQYRAQREAFYADFQARVSAQVAVAVLLAIAWAPKIMAMRKDFRVHDRRGGDGWYWSEREKIKAQVEWLRDHPLVRPESNLEVLLYAPAEVDCDHGRKRKVCVHIGERLEWRKHLQEARQPLLRISAARPVLRSWQRRIDELDTEILGLDVLVNPVTADPRLFCSRVDPAVLVPAQEEELTPPPPSKPGAPPDDLQNYLLETIGAMLVDAQHTVHDACLVTTKVLVYCCATGATRAESVALRARARGIEYADVEELVEDLCGSVERQWRALRERADGAVCGEELS
jgi:hypothetical protein